MSLTHFAARRAPGVLAALLAGSLASAVETGCTTPAGSPTRDAGPNVCPAAIDEALVATCSPEGLTCAPEYMCGILPATASCVCTGGRFACNDVTGASLGAGVDASCPPPLPTEKCPTTEAVAQLMACTEQGLQCHYASKCPSTPGFDTCECAYGMLATGKVGLRFGCPSQCVYAGPPIADDGGTVDDSAADVVAEQAPLDAGAHPDTSTADSPGG